MSENPIVSSENPPLDEAAPVPAWAAEPPAHPSIPKAFSGPRWTLRSYRNASPTQRR